MSLFNVLNIARDGILAQQAAVDATGQNITNATTPGYVRRQVLLQPRATGGSSAGGLEFVGTTRTMDAFAYARLVDEEGKRGEASARESALTGVQSLFSSATGGLAQSIDELYSSFAALSASPADPNLRQQVLTRAERLVQAFGALSGGLSTAEAQLATKAQSKAQDVNAQLAEVGTLNSRIREAQALGQDANDLRDRRDVVLRDLGTAIGARAIEDDKGEVTVYGGGVALVAGGVASTLDVSVGASGALTVRAQRSGGSSVDITTGIQGGELGGIIHAREVDVPALSQGLDTLAFDLAKSINQVHSAGYGTDGSTGRDLFQVSATAPGAAYTLRLDPDMAGHPERIAASSTASGLPGGSGNAVALSQLSAQNLSGGQSPGGTFARITGDLGARLASAQNEVELRTDTVAQAEALHASSSGVSLEEENVRLVQYQRAFEASTRVLRVADELLDGLIKSI